MGGFLAVLLERPPRDGVMLSRVNPTRNSVTDKSCPGLNINIKIRGLRSGGGEEERKRGKQEDRRGE